MTEGEEGIQSSQKSFTQEMFELAAAQAQYMGNIEIANKLRERAKMLGQKIEEFAVSERTPQKELSSDPLQQVDDVLTQEGLTDDEKLQLFNLSYAQMAQQLNAPLLEKRDKQVLSDLRKTAQERITGTTSTVTTNLSEIKDKLRGLANKLESSSTSTAGFGSIPVQEHKPPTGT